MTRRILLDKRQLFARVSWALAVKAILRGDHHEARKHVRNARPTFPPEYLRDLVLRWALDSLDRRSPRGRPRKGAEPSSGYAVAVDARRDREIADRVEYWRGRFTGKNRQAAERDIRSIAETLMDVETRRLLNLTGSDFAKRRPDLAKGRPLRPLPPLDDFFDGTAFDIATRVVAWELPALTPASVKRAVTRAQKNPK